jgi:hypothetical protein
MISTTPTQITKAPNVQDASKSHSLIIPAKPAGTGTIHDIASNLVSREIFFRRGEIYAVVTAAWYEGPYTTHRTLAAAIKESRRLARAGYSHAILDRDGRHQDSHWALP